MDNTVMIKLSGRIDSTNSADIENDILKQLEGKTYTFEKNEFGWKSLSFEQRKNEMIMSVKDEYGKAYSLSFGYKNWITNEVEGYPLYSMTARQKFKALEGPFHMAGCYAWRGLSACSYTYARKASDDPLAVSYR